jgi:5-methylcytosine-specific restriction endonuclease McrA
MNKKARILKSQNYKCIYCLKTLMFEQTTFDHVLPRSRGGTGKQENLVCCCKKCNGKKASHLPLNFLAVIRYEEDPTPQIRSQKKCPYCNVELDKSNTSGQKLIPRSRRRPESPQIGKYFICCKKCIKEKGPLLPLEFITIKTKLSSEHLFSKENILEKRS